MNKTVLIWMWFSTGCVSHNSSIRSMPLSAAPVGAVDAAVAPVEADCGWVVVTESEVGKVLGITVSNYVRPFDDSLYYCCPGEANTPICKQAVWTGPR